MIPTPSNKRRAPSPHPAQTNDLFTISKVCMQHRSKHDQHMDIQVCRKSMRSLRQVLSRYERDARCENPSELCSLYDSILTCKFCPHAMHTFGDGSLEEVLQRVAFLLSTTTSPSLHSSTNETLEAGEFDRPAPSPPPFPRQGTVELASTDPHPPPLAPPSLPLPTPQFAQPFRAS